jgi:hypothetical protein
MQINHSRHRKYIREGRVGKIGAFFFSATSPLRLRLERLSATLTTCGRGRLTAAPALGMMSLSLTRSYSSPTVSDIAAQNERVTGRVAFLVPVSDKVANGTEASSTSS